MLSNTRDFQLQQYLYKEKGIDKKRIEIALDSITQTECLFSEGVTIIDWGCGEGIA